METGQILQEKYRIGSVLSTKGGFGVVYKGTDLQTGKTVAVKEIRKKKADAEISQETAENQWEKDKQSFLNEAQILKKLGDIPRVVKLHGCSDEGNTAYIVLEYLDGKTLKDSKPPEKKFPPERAYRIFTELLKVLVSVHGHGVLHRDIAPDNVFLLSDGSIKLFDFGSSQTWREGQERSDWIGTKKKGYSSLEQITNRKDQGPWSDVYAAAATYYEMLTGERIPEADERRRKDTLVSPTGLGVLIPPEEEAVLLDALRVDAKERIRTAEEFLKRLQDAHQKKKQGKTLRFLAAAAAVLVLCAAGAVIVGTAGKGGSTENTELAETLQPTVPETEEPETEMSGEEMTSAKEGIVTVPDVVGMEEKEAAEVLGQQNLTYSKTAEPSLTVLKGKIIRQEPAAGTEAEEDSEVQIVVSLGDSEEETTAELVTIAPRTTEAPETAGTRRNNNAPQATQAPQTAAPNYAEPPTIGDNIG